MKSTSEVVVPKVPWIWIIPLIVIASVLLPLLLIFVPHPLCCASSIGSSGCGGGQHQTIGFMALSILILGSFVMPALAKKFRMETLVYLYVALICVGLFTGFYSAYHQWVALTHARVENQEIHGFALPLFWMPSAEVVRALFPGGNPFPWDAWLPVMITWSLYLTLPALWFYALTGILRRQWVDVEELPFPQAVAGFSMIEATSSLGKEKKDPRLRWAIIGIIVAFVIYLPITIVAIYPPFPDVYGWLKAPYYTSWWMGGLDLTAYSPFIRTNVVGPFLMETNPIFIMLGFLGPLDGLLSATFGYFVFTLILPQIFYSFGYYSGALDPTSDRWGKSALIWNGPPLQLQAFTDFGMIAAIALFPLFLHGKYLANTLRAALGKGPLAEASKEEPLSYRNAYILFAVATILLVAFLVVSNLTVASSLWLIFVLFFIEGIGYTRIWSYMGVTACSQQSRGWFKIIWPSMTLETQTPDYVMSLSLLDRVYGCDAGNSSSYGIASYSLHNYKLGNLAKVNQRNIFKIMLVSAIVSPFLGLLTMITTANYFGLLKIPATKEWDFMWVSDPSAYNVSPSADPWIGHAIAGFVFTIVLSLLRLRFLWWPLEPMGIFVGAQLWNITVCHFPFSLFIAWVAKYLVIKIGGTRVYENYGIPFVAGYLGGTGLSVLVYALFAYYRWVVPF